MFVRFFAMEMDNFFKVAAIVRLDGRVANVRYHQMNVKFPIATETAIVHKEAVDVSLVSKANTVIKVSVLDRERTSIH